jgi:hypothetical protein
MKANPWARVAVTVGAMLVVLLLAASWRFLESRGVFASVEAKEPHECRTVAEVPDVTDIAVDEGAGTVFVASRSAGLFALILGGQVSHLSGTPKDFHPVAVSLTHDPLVKLRTVSFGEDGRISISVFDLVPETLKETGRLTADVLNDPADLTALEMDRFYLVNRHASRTAFGRWLDDVFLLPRAGILYFDGMKFVTVAEQLNSPAGIALSPDGMHLYVGEDYPHALVSFTRNDLTGALENPAVLPFPSRPQKIAVSSDGSLLVAARPKSGMGQVFRVKVVDGVPQTPELVYARRDGEVTAAAQIGKHLLIGTDGQLKDCWLP